MFTEIISLCILINTTTNHHVFCYFSGHIDQLSGEVYENGWAEDKERSYSYDLDTNDDCQPTIQYLVSLLKEEA
mgnify:CR=1 FL=1